MGSFITKITNFFVQGLDKRNIENEEKIRYAVEVLAMNTPKTIALFLLSIALGITKTVLLIMLFYCILRFFSYGFHFNSSLGCFLWCVAMYVFGAYIVLNLNITNPIYLLITLPCFALYVLHAPAPTENTPMLEKQYKRLKSITLLVLALMLIIGFFSEAYLKNIIVYSVICQAININPILFKIFKQKKGVVYHE